jgi:chromosome segregation ATPase
VIKRTLNRIGVIGPRHYRHLLAQLQKAEARHAKLLGDLEAARADARACKSKVEESAKALRKRQADQEQHLRRIEKLTTELEKVKGESRQRFETVKRDLALAREALMVVDVKLDILEGAANVLDVRTRASSAQRDATAERAV